MVKQKKSDYPEQNPDWLLVEHYKKEGSKFGCLYCTKTHAVKDCPHKKKEAEMKPSFNYKSMYEDKEDDERYISYGW